METFPEHYSPAAKRFWLAEAEAMIRADELLRTGEVADEHLYDLAILATGDEDRAQAILEARMEAKARAAVRPA